MEMIDEFEAARPRLRSLAHRMLGSVHDAEDAVQATWLRAQSTQAATLDNPTRWLTTVTARLCLDQLRSRERRRELPLLADAIPAGQLAADEELLQHEEVSRALLVLLSYLTPSQRVAYVLHDLFTVPFDEVAQALDTSPTNAKKLASRARRRLQGADLTPAAEAPPTPSHSQIVHAFLSAARGGDLNRLITLMAPDVVRTVDKHLLLHGATSEVTGARAVAEETRYFSDRVHASVPMFVNGNPAALIAPGGHALAVITFEITDHKITHIAITRLEPTDEVRLWD